MAGLGMAKLVTGQQTDQPFPPRGRLIDWLAGGQHEAATDKRSYRPTARPRSGEKTSGWLALGADHLQNNSHAQPILGQGQ
jgi:hypothetical protein